MDVDKGRLCTFGVSIRGLGVGSVRLSLTPVKWQGGKVAQVEDPVYTKALSGTFDWIASSRGK